MKSTPDSSFAYDLHDVTCLFRKHFDRRALRLGLTRAQWRALKSIRRREGLSQSELAEFLEMEPIAVGRVIDRLAVAGFVERRADPNDRRRWRLYLTVKAHGVTDDMEVIAAELRRESLVNIDDGDFGAFQRVLKQLRANLSAIESANESHES
ncbi:MarR family winged helix-turn-helix transcriptional regulator [Dokdonella immobilis]|uniref:DNA-binding transcriptional regulator, MarR family n=1 Tax=Dokdonella immobilis TaxID=578942 RepID=A0A1I4YRZ2_9GAMM|nr:MarR family transcriptional regulator [Dokdonella immobilis]SFN40533.1 DNA-binding transcriptional regulator, MarR family [Dokdonella immobilis]